MSHIIIINDNILYDCSCFYHCIMCFFSNSAQSYINPAKTYSLLKVGDMVPLLRFWQNAKGQNDYPLNLNTKIYLNWIHSPACLFSFTASERSLHLNADQFFWSAGVFVCIEYVLIFSSLYLILLPCKFITCTLDYNIYNRSYLVIM